MRVGVFLLLLLLPLAAWSEPLRVATYNAGLSRKGPGLLLRDILKRDPQVMAAVAAVDALEADVIVLTDVDYDLHLTALGAFADLLAQDYPHRFARRPNTGMATGLDLDGDGRLGGPRDAQGFGWFSGDGGMAVLSRHPVLEDQVRDFSGVLWRDLPDALLFQGMTAEARAIQRLSTTAHWEVPVDTPQGVLRLLAWHATPPVFDGPEDRNGRRNHDEAALWAALIEGRLAMDPPAHPYVVLGDANADPVDGDGRPEGILRLLEHPALQDPLRGRKTASYEEAGPLRLDYVLPAAGMRVIGAGVAGGPTGSAHQPVWVDLAF